MDPTSVAVEEGFQKPQSPQDLLELHYPDYAAHTFALNRTGTNAVLTVQKLLAVVDVQSGSRKAFRKLNAVGGSGRGDVKAVEWGPLASNANLIASAFQNQVDIWDLDLERAGSLKATLKAHTKPTYGLNWSGFDPNTIATCAADSFVYVWDLRDYRKPQDKFKVTVSGASAVQWNRLNSQLLASVHDCDVRIWDRRKSSSAVGYISAHYGKINCLDWSHQDEKKLVTCSQDSNIKIWNIQQPRSPLNILRPWGPQPVLRTLFTPFGDGIVSSCAPTLHVNTDPNIFLWANSADSSPRHCFSGSQGATHEMKWFSKSTGLNRFHLITWSKMERKLRIWTVSKEVEDMCKLDHSIESEILSAVSQTSPPTTTSVQKGTTDGKDNTVETGEQHTVTLGTVTSPMAASYHSLSYSSSVHTLEKEFSLVDVDIPNVVIEDRDHSKRVCRVTCTSGLKHVALVISFPSYYPTAAPSFTIDNTVSSVDQPSQQTLLLSLTEVANASVKENKPCLQLCLRKLSSLIDTLQYKADMPKVSVSYPSPLNQYGKRKESYGISTFADEYIPFPRTNGARFCGNGLLVVFVRPPNLALVSAESQKKTPKSMSEVTTLKSVKIASRGPAFRQSIPGRTSSSPQVPSIHTTLGLGSSKPQQHTSIMPFVVKEKPSRTSTGSSGTSQNDGNPSNPYVSVITINDLSNLLPFSLDLAKSYKLSANTIVEYCEQHKALAQSSGRSDLVQTWTLVQLVISVKSIPPPLAAEDGLPWSAHPMGRQLVESLLEHYWSLYDVQTVAILSCALQMYDVLVQNFISKEKGEQVAHPSELSRSTQIPMSSSSALSPNSPPMENRQMWGALAGKTSYHLNDFSFHGEDDFGVDEVKEHFENCLLLSKTMSRRCSEARCCYGNILGRWQLLTQKAEVLKYQPTKVQDHEGIEFSNFCQHCNSSTRGPKCHCQKMAFNCIICHTAVRGLSNFCLSCGHGGHAAHLQKWFATHSLCPSGCGCHCLVNSLSMF